jgi:predicted flap endonuclease-1-like 5' DNA nuclease
MSYLLTLGWPWFAAACALGALIGYLTTSDAKNAPTAPGWNIIAIASALGAGAAASALGVFDGRAALTLDVFLMAAIAYLVGLPLGGALRMTQAPTVVHAGKRPIVVLRGAQSEIREPSSAPSPEPQNESLANAHSAMPPSVEPTLKAAAPAAEKLKESAAQMRAQSGKATPSARPGALSAPRGASADDLSKIKGLGPKSVEKLHALGVFHYDQIAGWSDDNIKWIEASIGAAGRVKRNGWVEQARALSGKAHAGHSADAA